MPIAVDATAMGGCVGLRWTDPTAGTCEGGSRRTTAAGVRDERVPACARDGRVRGGVVIVIGSVWV